MGYCAPRPLRDQSRGSLTATPFGMRSVGYLKVWWLARLRKLNNILEFSVAVFLAWCADERVGKIAYGKETS